MGRDKSHNSEIGSVPAYRDVMWCERVVRNCQGDSAADRAQRVVDWVDLEWNECGRVLKKQTRDGQSVRVLLPPGQRLRHNDVIFEDQSKSIAVNVVPCEIIVAFTPDAAVMAMLALELGNLHLPVQIGDGEIAFIEDGPAMAVVDSMGVRWTKRVRRFEPVQPISAPSVDLSPGLRVVIRSQKAEGQADPRSAESNP